MAYLAACVTEQPSQESAEVAVAPRVGEPDAASVEVVDEPAQVGLSAGLRRWDRGDGGVMPQDREPDDPRRVLGYPHGEPDGLQRLLLPLFR